MPLMHSGEAPLGPCPVPFRNVLIRYAAEKTLLKVIRHAPILIPEPMVKLLFRPDTLSGGLIINRDAEILILSLLRHLASKERLALSVFSLYTLPPNPLDRILLDILHLIDVPQKTTRLSLDKQPRHTSVNVRKKATLRMLATPKLRRPIIEELHRKLPTTIEVFVQGLVTNLVKARKIVSRNLLPHVLPNRESNLPKMVRLAPGRKQPLENRPHIVLLLLTGHPIAKRAAPPPTEELLKSPMSGIVQTGQHMTRLTARSKHAGVRAEDNLASLQNITSHAPAPEHFGEPEIAILVTTHYALRDRKRACLTRKRESKTLMQFTESPVRRCEAARHRSA